MIKTYWMGKSCAEDYHITHNCEFCNSEREARYWTQASGKNWKPLSRCIFHCQTHRANARHVIAKELTENT